MTGLGRVSPSRDSAVPPAAELDRLLHRTALGDDRAFGELYDLTVRGFFRLALAMLGDEVQAEAAICAAYAQIWANATEYDARAHRPLSWMTTIAYQFARTARGAQAA